MDRQTTISGILGAAAAVAGLLVVFQGFLISSLASLPMEASSRVRKPYVLMVGAALISFLVADVTAVLALMWLVGVELYWLVVSLAFASFGLLAAVSVIGTLMLVRR